MLCIGMLMKTRVFLCLGSNLGDRKGNLDDALRLISDFADIRNVSSVYETAPVGYLDQPDFLNVVCEISTDLKPQELLERTQGIERELGRRKTVRFGPRNIDVDIILYGNEIINSDKLTIPHARMTDRAFVMVPLCEIAPDVVHPVRHMTIHDITDKIDKSGVKKWRPEMFNLTVRGHFSSAHALRGYKGKCEALHGHTFRAAVKIQSEKQNEIGIVYDFTDLKAEFNKILDELDHHNLNELDYFRDINPSSENLAIYIYNKMKPLFDGTDIKLVSVEVWESESSSVEYIP